MTLPVRVLEKYKAEVVPAMQSPRGLPRLDGISDEPPPPSAEAEVPVTFGDKFKNFWYYYRIPVICTFFMLIVIAVCIHQCATRVNYDMEIAIYTSNPVSDDDCKKINEAKLELMDKFNILEECIKVDKDTLELIKLEENEMKFFDYELSKIK